MKLQFINENDTIAFQGIFQSRIANRQTLCEIPQ